MTLWKRCENCEDTARIFVPAWQPSGARFVNGGDRRAFAKCVARVSLGKTLAGAREVLLQGSFYEVSLALVGVASLA